MKSTFDRIDGYNIRLVMPEDRDGVEQLVREMVKERGEEFDEKRFNWGMLRRIYDNLQRHGTLVAEKTEDGEIVGILFGEIRVDPFGLNECVIKHVFVKAEHRGKGLAKSLIKNAISHMQSIKIDKIRVNLPIDAKMSASMFEEFGFRESLKVLELKLRK